MIGRQSLFIAAIALSSFVSLASAHPGHGEGSTNGTGLGHYLTEPMHVGFMIGLALLLVLAVRAAFRHFTSGATRTRQSPNSP